MSTRPYSRKHGLIHLGMLASHYRRPASCARSPDIATEFNCLAQTYEDEAASLFGHAAEARS